MKLSDISAAMDNLLDALDERINTLCEQVGIEPDDPVLSDDEDKEDEDGAEDTENGDNGADGEDNADSEGEDNSADDNGTDGADDSAADDMGADGGEAEVEEGMIGGAAGGILGSIAGGAAGAAVGHPTIGKIAGSVAGAAIGDKIGDALSGTDEASKQSDDTGCDGEVSLGEAGLDPNQPPVETNEADAANDSIVSQLEGGVDGSNESCQKTDECGAGDAAANGADDQNADVQNNGDGAVVGEGSVGSAVGGTIGSIAGGAAGAAVGHPTIGKIAGATIGATIGDKITGSDESVDEGCCGKACKKGTKAKKFADFKKWTAEKKGVDEAVKDDKYVVKCGDGYFKAGGSELEDEVYTTEKGDAKVMTKKDAEILIANLESGRKCEIEKA